MSSKTTPAAPTRPSRDADSFTPTGAGRGLAVLAAMGLAFLLIAGQLVRLSGRTQPMLTLSSSEPVATSFARPDIVDRHGRLLATDVVVPSLYADPALVIDPDEAVERLMALLPDLDAADLRRSLVEPGRRFVWIRRALPPRLAQQIHDLGLPGLAFRNELKRAYPAGSLAAHVIGAVNVDNKGVAGLERLLDETGRVEAVHGATTSERPPLATSLDVGVQHALEDELAASIARYRAKGAAGLVLDVATGEVLASASLPAPDPNRRLATDDEAQRDRIAGGTYELGSIFKVLTIAEALERGAVGLDTPIDVREPLAVGRFTIKDLHPAGRPLTVAEVFVHSSNVGAGRLAIGAGGVVQRAFLDRLGLLGRARTETGPVAPPQLPERWGPVETVTIAYGHGLAVAPVQFAAAAAALVNGGRRVAATYAASRDPSEPREQVLSTATSAAIRRLMRLNVTHRHGTGRRADVPGYEIGGKTGTAEIAVAGGYAEKQVISSFLAAFPMSAPRALTLVMLFEPTGTEETRGQITAGVNAAPTTGRLVARIAPILGIVPGAAAEAAVSPAP